MTPKTSSPEHSARAAYYLRTVAKLLLDFDNISRRSMFGCEAFFTKGNILALIDPQDEAICVKITDQQKYRELLAKQGARPFAPGGASMRHWVVLPEALAKNEAQLEMLLRRAYDSASALPAKKPKTRAKRL